MAIMVGGSKAVETGKRHGIAYALQYVNEEPALVLWNPRMPHGAGAFIVCLSAVYLYAEDDYLVQQSLFAARHMGFSETKHDVMNIAKVIEMSIDDLVRMPPEPEDKLVTMGEAEITIGGHKFVIDVPGGSNVH